MGVQSSNHNKQVSHTLFVQEIGHLLFCGISTGTDVTKVSLSTLECLSCREDSPIVVILISPIQGCLGTTLVR